MQTLIPVINEDARLYQQLRPGKDPVKFPPGVAYIPEDTMIEINFDGLSALTNGHLRAEDPCGVRGSFLEQLIAASPRSSLRTWLETETRKDVIEKINARLATPPKRSERE